MSLPGSAGDRRCLGLLLHRKDLLVKCVQHVESTRTPTERQSSFGGHRSSPKGRHLEIEDPEMEATIKYSALSSGSNKNTVHSTGFPWGFIPLWHPSPTPTRRGSHCQPVVEITSPRSCKHCILPELSPNGASLSRSAGLKVTTSFLHTPHSTHAE